MSARVTVLLTLSSECDAYTIERAGPPPSVTQRSHAGVAVVQGAGIGERVAGGTEALTSAARRRAAFRIVNTIIAFNRDAEMRTERRVRLVVAVCGRWPGRAPKEPLRELRASASQL